MFNAAVLILRLGVGLIFAGHGAAKAFGWWGGPGWAGWNGAMERMGFRPARLFAVPEAAFAMLRPIPALGPLAARLTLSLQVDDSATRALLDWTPPVPTEIGLTTTARAFRAAI